jgi:N-acetylglucosaminyldiphosphoundecaprenol N-acetyl-beta-D-mannosaminyltransferase
MVVLAKTGIAILGVPVDNITMDEVINAIELKIAEGGFHQIATANVDFMMNSVHDSELHEILCRCDCVVADGMPLVWASRLLGMKLRERVTGADLVPRLAELSSRRGYRIFLLGASEESSAGAAAVLEKNFPGVCIAGRYSPEHRSIEQMDHEEILSRIEAARPDILLVAFGNPKQEIWLAMHRGRLKVPVCIGVGASLDYLSGRVSRAPMWMQRSGLEWTYRMLQEPTRLVRRYARNAAHLLRHLPLQVMAMNAQVRRNSIATVSKKIFGAVTVFYVDGDLTGNSLAHLDFEVRNTVQSRSHVVLDLSKAGYIGPDGLGTLIRLANLVHSWKRELWLTGVKRQLRWVLDTTQVGSNIRFAPKATDALRRIEPEFQQFPRYEGDWAYFHVGGRLVPIHTLDVPIVYKQMEELIALRMPAEPLSHAFSKHASVHER